MLPESMTMIEALTARQHEVLQLVADGMTNKEIAEQLIITEHTVERHLSEIYQKLAVTNRVQAARWIWITQLM